MGVKIMQDMFYYNWQVRDDWFHWCNNLSEKELTKQREGGMGSFLKTYFILLTVNNYGLIR